MSSTAYAQLNDNKKTRESPLKAPDAAAALAAEGQVEKQVEGRSEQESLQSAFALFNELSGQLSESYFSLEQQVSNLNEELNQAQGQRLREIKEKQRVASRLQHLLDMLPGGVVVLDQHGVVSDCNPVAVELLGEPLLGELWLNVIERCFAPRSDDGHELSLKDGRRIQLSTRSLDVEPGQIILLTDQTETRALQTQLSRHERLSTMGRMMSSLAHQLRTPLSAAMLYAGQLSEGNLDPVQTQKFSGKIVSRLNVLESQIRDMLIFVKGDVKLTDTVFVEDILMELERAMEVPLLANKISSRFENHTSDVRVHCNLPTIVGALLNLVTNAMQAGGKNCQVMISASLLNDETLRIAIEDNGPGMQAEILEQTREPFFTTKAQGTGLGLAVVRAVARAHHGEFFLESKPGNGTSAGMLLPVQPSPAHSVS